jgi:hypothetical protein
MCTKKFLQKFGYAPSKSFASPVLGQNTSKNIGLKGGGGGHHYEPAQGAHISWAGTDAGIIGVVPDKMKGTSRGNKVHKR